MKFGKITIKGELMPWGDNLSSYLAGIGQDVATQAGWLQVGMKLSDTLSLNIGYLEDNPVDAELTPTAAADVRTHNVAGFLNVRYHMNSSTQLGLEVMSWRTGYDEFTTGKDVYNSTRVGTSLIYKF